MSGVNHRVETVDPRDFPDWLNPVVVKELRQGLRQMPFTLVFLLAHLILASAFLMAFDALRSGGQLDPRAGLFISQVIFTSFAVFGLFIQPMRGLFTVSEETSTRALDLLLLSGLDPARIFIGKWLSLCSQTLLLAASLLPYLVLRYHLGGMRLFAELSTLYWMLFSSGILTAVAVTASVMKSKLSKYFLPIIAGFGLGVLKSLFMESRSLSAALQGDATAPGFSIAFLALSAVAAATIRLVLHAGAAQIACAQEIGSARVRVASLGFILLLLLIPGWPFDERSLIAALFSCVLLCATFVEPPVNASYMAQDYLALGRRGRWMARFLLPGWTHGALFAPLVILPNLVSITLLSARWSPFSYSSNESLLVTAIALPLLPFFPGILVGMLDLGDRDLLSRACNPILLGFCLIPYGILVLVAAGADELRYIPVAMISFVLCLLLVLMGWDYRYAPNVKKPSEVTGKPLRP